MMLPLVVCFVGASSVVGSWMAYMASVPSGRVPVRPVGHFVAQTLGMTAATVGVVSAGSGPNLYLALVPASVAWTMGGLFFFLFTQRRTPLGNLRVAVGDPLPAFTARTGDGGTFDSGQLVGGRTLFKFFRGHW